MKHRESPGTSARPGRRSERSERQEKSTLLDSKGFLPTDGNTKGSTTSSKSRRPRASDASQSLTKKRDAQEHRDASRSITPNQGRAKRLEEDPPKKSRRPKVYSRVNLDFDLWMYCALEEYRAHAKTLPKASRKRLLRNVQRLKDCARAIKAKFATSAPTNSTTGEPYRCGLRGCLLHRRVLSETRYERLESFLSGLRERGNEAAKKARRDLRPRIVRAKRSYKRLTGTPLEGRQKLHLASLRLLREELRTVDEFRFHFLTVNLPHDPRCTADVTVEALRARVLLGKELERHLHTALFTEALRPSVAWVSSVECGDHGLVHVHILYRGPERDEAEVLDAASEVHDKVTVQVDPVKRKEVRKVLRYITKPDGIRAEDWHRFKRGERRKVPHPELDARFILAVRGVQRVVSRGLFRRSRS